MYYIFVVGSQLPIHHSLDHEMGLSMGKYAPPVPETLKGGGTTNHRKTIGKP